MDRCIGKKFLVFIISHNLETEESGFCSSLYLDSIQSNPKGPQPVENSSLAVILNFVWKCIIQMSLWMYESGLVIGRKVFKSQTLPSIQPDHFIWIFMWIRRIALIGVAFQFTTFALYTLLNALLILWNYIQNYLAATRNTWMYLMEWIHFILIEVFEVGRLPILFGNFLIFAAALAFLGEKLLSRL